MHSPSWAWPLQFILGMPLDMVEDFTNRRLRNDRRERPTPLFNRFFLWGRRRGPRRGRDDHPTCYVDRPGLGWVLAAMVLLVAGIADAWLTHFGITQHLASEANPVIRTLYYGIGPSLTWSLKIAITLVGVWLLLAHRRWPMATAGLLLLAIYYLVIFALHMAGLGVAIILL